MQPKPHFIAHYYYYYLADIPLPKIQQTGWRSTLRMAPFAPQVFSTGNRRLSSTTCTRHTFGQSTVVSNSHCCRQKFMCVQEMGWDVHWTTGQMTDFCSSQDRHLARGCTQLHGDHCLCVFLSTRFWPVKEIKTFCAEKFQMFFKKPLGKLVSKAKNNTSDELLNGLCGVGPA